LHKACSAEPNRKKVAELTWEQIRTIAQDKMVDLNCFTVDEYAFPASIFSAANF